MLGLGLSVTQLAVRGLRLTDLAAAIRALFAAGEQGVWYDPSDLTTLYQDAAGTTPVTAVEQPVGLLLDKSKGLVLGPEIFTDVCVIQNSGTSGAYSAGAISNSLAGTTGYPRYRWAQPSLQIGKIYKITIVQTNADVFAHILFDNAIIAGAASLLNSSGTVTCYVKYNGVDNRISLYADGTVFSGSVSISVRELPGNHATQTTSTSRPVLSARYNLLTATETLATQTVTTRATTQTLRFEGAGTVTLSGTATGTYSAGSHSVTTTAGNLTLTVSGTVTKADLRAANMGVGLSAYQRVNTATDYDTAGFPHYLRFDGVDDSLVTNSIDFTATDKMTVFAGVRKLSDSAVATVAELSANSGVTPNTFAVFAPGAVAPNYAFRSSGTSDSVATATTFASPITNVLVGLGEVASDTAILRIDGTQAASSTADQGTGNYGNYPLYIGRRGGTSLPFNGHLYSLIVRGAQSTDQQIIDAERYVNDKTRAY